MLSTKVYNLVLTPINLYIQNKEKNYLKNIILGNTL